MISTCVNQGNYLLIEIGGTYSLKFLLSAIHEVAEHCRRENLNKALIDLRGMSGNPNIFDRYRLGLEIVRVWGPELRVAILGRAEMTNRVTENTAVNRGAKIRIKTSLAEALQWLDLEQEGEHA